MRERLGVEQEGRGQRELATLRNWKQLRETLRLSGWQEGCQVKPQGQAGLWMKGAMDQCPNTPDSERTL